MFSWLPSSVFGFPFRNDKCGNESVCCCASTGKTLPKRRLFRGRNAGSACFRRRWLGLRVRFDVNRAFPERKPRGRFVRWTPVRSAAVAERQRVSDAPAAVRRPTLSVSGAQVQRRCSEPLVVTVHGHGPGNEEARSPGICAETVTDTSVGSSKLPGIAQSPSHLNRTGIDQNTSSFHFVSLVDFDL